MMPAAPLIKVYGHLWPIDVQLSARLDAICQGALPEPAPGIAPVFCRDGNLGRISFEGIYFPLDDLLALLARELTPAMQGKLDLLDLENWRLVRHSFVGGAITSASAPLNNVLAYSGH